MMSTPETTSGLSVEAETSWGRTLAGRRFAKRPSVLRICLVGGVLRRVKGVGVCVCVLFLFFGLVFCGGCGVGVCFVFLFCWCFCGGCGVVGYECTCFVVFFVVGVLRWVWGGWWV